MRTGWFVAAALIWMAACSTTPGVVGNAPDGGNLLPAIGMGGDEEARRGAWWPDEGRDFLVARSDAFLYRKGYTPPEPGRPALALRGITGLRRAWQAPLPACSPGEAYRFSAEVYRPMWRNGVYPEISVWGQTHRLDTTLLTGVFQPITVHLTCPEAEGREDRFRFLNPQGDAFFAIRAPSLVRETPLPAPREPEAFRPMAPGRFPIGVYGAAAEDLSALKALGVNAVVLGGSGEELAAAIRECNRLDLFYFLATPRNPERLPAFLEAVSRDAMDERLGFYVNDEPGIRSFPVSRAEAVQRILKERFPASPTAMAVVRPQVARDYREAADYFLLDQYPVPNMPMTWLTDAMDHVAGDLGAHRTAAVVQAFGGEEWADHGWPRLPTRQEMENLAFQSVIHGARGVFFFSWPALKETADGPERLADVVSKLQSVAPWLTASEVARKLPVRMTSTYRTDHRGRPAVRCALRVRDGRTLLLCANSVPTYTEAEIDLEPLPSPLAPRWQERFAEEVFYRDGMILRARFAPLQVRVWTGDVSREP